MNTEDSLSCVAAFCLGAFSKRQEKAKRETEGAASDAAHAAKDISDSKLADLLALRSLGALERDILVNELRSRLSDRYERMESERADAARYRQALIFYGAFWRYNSGFWTTPDIMDDRGAVAREALNPSSDE